MADNAIQAWAQGVVGGTSLECGITQNAAFARLAQDYSVTHYTSSGALTIQGGIHSIDVAGAGAMTLAPPTAAQAGIRMHIVSTTANAHVVTLTEGWGGSGTTANDTATFGNLPGNGLICTAVGLHWLVSGGQGITIA